MFLDPKSFATIAASEGGALHAYLRTLGLLLISHAEAMEEDEEVTDLTLGERIIRGMAKRSYGFLTLAAGENARPTSVRMTAFGAGLQRLAVPVSVLSHASGNHNTLSHES
eukprot:symbB.v1.2.014105.t1/scaffold1018.1/size143800/7